MASFADHMKDHQVEWALDHGISTEMLEERKGVPSWVLRREFREKNLYMSKWWEYIAGHEHRWARALNSSQCFAVNLFAPLADDPQLARKVWHHLWPRREIDVGAVVEVRFEHTPEKAPVWLGESGQPTQVDVFFTIRRQDRPLGYLLIEVKFTEAKFGECRGFHPRRNAKDRNLDPGRCEDLKGILRDPGGWCWLAETQGRKYWEIMTSPGSSFDLGRVPLPSPCSFRDGLYQMMRNRCLADSLMQTTENVWADVAVCIHPANEKVRVLDNSVAGHEDVVEAMNEMLPDASIGEIDPRGVVEAIRRESSEWIDWADTMIRRYELV
ncbi:MAG: hypothetical protein O7H41_20805 [Planctomycetota bacterium]|nr:hypothetical protein [Planctomycetota bacterium]